MQNNKLQYKFLFIISTAYLAVDMNMQGLLGLMPFLSEEFSLNSSQVGLYSTFYFFLATIVAVFSGSIVDKIGSKRGLVFGTSLVGLLMIFHTLVPSYSLILLLALFTGLVFSILTPSLNKAVMKKVSAKNRATSMGIMQIGGGLGGFAGATLLPFLGNKLGWRNALFISAVFALLMGLFIYLFYKEDEKKKEDIKKEKNDLSFKESLKLLFNNKNFIIVCLFALILGFNSGSIPAHYTLYLTQDLDLSKTAAGFAFGLIHIGSIIARPLWGWFDDKFLNGSRSKGLVFIGISLALTTLYYALILTNIKPPIYIIYLSSLVLGFMCLGWLGLYFTTIIELASEKLAGIGTGLSLVFMRTGVLVSPPLFGLLADLNNSYRLSWLILSLVTLSFTFVFAYLFRNKYDRV